MYYYQLFCTVLFENGITSFFVDLERQISVRTTREELVKRGVLHDLPEVTGKVTTNVYILVKPSGLVSSGSQHVTFEHFY